MPGTDIGAGIGGVVGGIAGLAMAGKGGQGDYEKAVAVWKKLQLSNFDMRELSPPELRVFQEQMPQVYNAIQAQAPTQVQDSAEGRAGQVGALGQMQEVAQEGAPLVDRLEQQAVARKTMDASSSAQAAALRNLAARGALSGGDEIQARLAGNQTASNLARDLAGDAAKEAALRRLSAIGAAGSQAGALRAGDVNVSGQQADIANRFNEMWAAQQNAAAQYNAGARERAATANVNLKNETGNTNELNRYGVELENLNRKNRLKGDIFGQNLAKTQGLAGAYTGLGAEEDAVQSAKIKSLQGIGSGVGGAVGSFL